MDRESFLDDLQARLSLLMRSTPAADLEQNLKAVLGQAFQRMELVTREEFDLQRELLARTRARLEALEARLAALEGTGVCSGQRPQAPADDRAATGAAGPDAD